MLQHNLESLEGRWMLSAGILVTPTYTTVHRLVVDASGDGILDSNGQPQYQDVQVQVGDEVKIVCDPKKKEAVRVDIRDNSVHVKIDDTINRVFYRITDVVVELSESRKRDQLIITGFGTESPAVAVRGDRANMSVTIDYDGDVSVINGGKWSITKVLNITSQYFLTGTHEFHQIGQGTMTVTTSVDSIVSNNGGRLNLRVVDFDTTVHVNCTDGILNMRSSGVSDVVLQNSRINVLNTGNTTLRLLEGHVEGVAHLKGSSDIVEFLGGRSPKGLRLLGAEFYV